MYSFFVVGLIFHLVPVEIYSASEEPQVDGVTSASPPYPAHCQIYVYLYINIYIYILYNNALVAFYDSPPMETFYEVIKCFVN